MHQYRDAQRRRQRASRRRSASSADADQHQQRSGACAHGRTSIRSTRLRWPVSKEGSGASGAACCEAAAGTSATSSTSDHAVWSKEIGEWAVLRRDLRQRWRFGGLQRLRHDRLQRRQRLFQRNRFVQLRRRRVQAVSGDLVGPARCLVQVRLQRFFLRCRWRWMARRQLQAGFFRPRQHLLMAMQLRPDDGKRWASQPSRRAASSASSKTRSAGADNTVSRRSQCVLNGRLQHNHHDLRSGVNTLKIFGSSSSTSCIRMRRCLAQALARRAGTGQQATAGAAWVSLTGHGRSPTGRTRYASGPVPGTACPERLDTDLEARWRCFVTLREVIITIGASL